MNRLIFVLLCGLVPGSANAEQAVLFAHSDCRRVTVTTPGEDILTGIEDLALLPGGKLLLSANDRSQEDGGADGLFVLNPISVEDTVTATRLLGPSPDPDRPHGVAYHPSSGRLAYIERPVDKDTQIVWGHLGDGVFQEQGRHSAPRFCRANDLTFQETRLLVTLDRANCDTALGDLIPGAKTGTVTVIELASGETQREGAFEFANGIADTDEGVWVAETRGGRLSRMGAPMTVDLPGSPDNLSASNRGILAAVHPSLFGLALHRAGIWGRAGSRVVQITPGHPEPGIVFDDPKGDLYSAATSAVFAGSTLIAGSATDSGLLVCAPKGRS